MMNLMKGQQFVVGRNVAAIMIYLRKFKGLVQPEEI